MRYFMALTFGALTVVGSLSGAGCGKNTDTLKASGTVEATEAQLGFQAVGRIENVFADEGDSVRSGEVLARLDAAEMKARIEQAEAQADAARAVLTEMEHGSRREEIAQARAARDAASQRFNDAARDLERVRTLHDGGAVSQETFDKTQVAHEVARNQLEQAEEQFKLVEQGPRAERIEAARAQLAQAEAVVRTMQASLDNMIIVAPFDGIVTVRHREEGETVPLGSPVLNLLNRNDRWIRIYVPETRVGELRIGQTASITFDSYPDKTYRGEVVFIASQAEFTPKTVQTAEERVKLVYAVKVRIVDDPSYDLKPGVPADVELSKG
jgi:HlyD family secretion protein